MSVSATGGTPSLAYQWYSNASNANTGGTIISGATSSTYTPSSTSAGTTYYYCIVSASGNGCTATTTNAVAVVVVADPAITVQPTAITQCIGGTSALSLTATGGTPSLTYQWYSNASNANSGGTIISGATSSSYTPPSTSAGTTYYYCIVSASGDGCASTTSSAVAVIVQTTPTAGTIAASQTICNAGDPAAFTSSVDGTGDGLITYIWQSSLNNSTWSTISGATASTYDVSSGLTATTYYRRITVSTLNAVACQSIPSNILTVTVQSVPTAGTIASSQTICYGGDPAAFTSSIDGTGIVGSTISYIWQSSTDNTNFSTITGATSSTYDVSNGLTTSTYYRRITVATLNGVACQSAATSSVLVTVQTVPTAGSIAASQTICYGGDPAAFTSVAGTGIANSTITYIWQSSTDNTNFSTISGAIGATYDPPSGLTVTTYYRRITVATLNSIACQSIPSNVLTVTVQSLPTAGSIAVDQTICNGGDPAAFTSSVDGSGDGVISYKWQSSLNNSTWADISGATSSTYDVPNGLTATTYYRRITISTLNSVACQSVPTNVLTVTVQTVPVAGTIAASQTVCYNGDPAAFTSSVAGSGSGIITYKWQSSLDNISFTDIAGATLATYDVPSGLTATTYYRRITISTLNSIACQSVPTNVLTITVQSVPTAGSIGSNQTICNGGDPAAFTSVSAGSGDGVISYKWQSSTDNISFADISGATLAAYDPPSGLTVTTYYRRITISTLNTVACQSIPTSAITVTVQSVPTAGSIASNQTICSGGDPAAFTNTLDGTGVGTISYIWQSSTDNVTYTAILGETTSTYDPPSGLTNTTYYRRITVSTLNGVACQSSPSSSIIVTVNSVTAGSIGTSQTICYNGDPAAFTSVAAGSAPVGSVISYRWQSSLDNITYSDIAGATLATYDAPSGLTNSTYYRRITVSTLNTVVCESNPTTAILVTVQSVPTAGSIAADQTICYSGDPAAFTSVANGTGDGVITYKWQSSLNNSTWSDIASASNSTYDVPTGLTATTYYRRITISTLNSIACQSIPSNVLTVTVQSVPTAGTIAASQTICNGGDPVAFTSSVDGTGIAGSTISYIWQSSLNNSTWSDIAGATASTYDVANGLTATTYYRRITVSTLNGIACQSIASNVLTVIVQSVPTAGSIAASQTICNGGDPLAFTSVAGSGTVGAVISYIWQSSTDNSNFTTINGASSATYDVPSGLTTTTYYRRITVATLNSIACQSVPTNVLTVTVQSVPTAGSIGSDQTICSGGDPALFTSISVASGDGSITYVWQSSTDNITYSNISLATSTTYDAPSGLTTTTYYRRIATSTLNGNACVANSSPVLVTVNPIPTVNTISNQAVCVGQQFSTITFSGTVPSTVYNWSNNNTNIGLGSSGTGNISAFTSTNTTNASILSTVTVTPTYTYNTVTCTGTSKTFTLTVNPKAVIANTTTSACSGSGFTVTPSNGTDIVPSGTTYAWSALPVVTGGLTGGATASLQSSISGTLTNPTNIAQTATYTITPTSGTCTGATFTVVATINPKPVVPNQTATICSGETFTTAPSNAAPTTIIPTGTTYTWTVAPNANVTGESDQSTGQSSISQTLTNTTNIPQTVVYTVTPTSGDAGSCVGSNFTVTVTVNPTPVVANKTSTICSGTAFTTTPANGTDIVPVSTTYTWTVAPNADVTGETDQAVGQSSISQTLTNTSNTVQTVVYTVTPKSGAAGACVGSTFTITVTVNPRPTIDAISNQAVCAGSTVSGVTITGSVASTVYTWANNTTSIGLGASGTGNITSFTGINATNIPVVSTVTVTPTYTNNAVACVGSTSTFTITINPKPVVPNQTATICSGAAFTTAPTNNAPTTIIPSGTTYTWTVVDNTNVTGESDQAVGQSNISQTLTNLTNTAQTVVYTVTPTSGAAGNCVGSTFTVTVTVSPKATIANKTVSACSGSGFTVTPSNGTDIVPSGTTYAWSSLPVVTGGLTGGATASLQSSISGTLTNPTNIAQTATYTVTPTSGSCTGATFTVVATINPKPVVPNQTATICSGETFTTAPSNAAPTTIIPTGTTYTWTVAPNANVTGESDQSTGQSSISQTLTNTTNTVQTVVYTVTPTSGDAGSCVGSTFTVTVTVNPKATIANKTVSACSGSGFTVTPTNGTDIIPTGTTYAWSAPSVTGNLTGGVSASAQASIAGTLTNPTNIAQTATYTVTPTSGTCNGATFTVVATINPKPVVPNQTATICSGETFTTAPTNNAPTTIIPTGTTYTWTVVDNLNVTGESAQITGQSSISQTLTNNTNIVQTVTYTVTPKSGDAGACVGSTFTITVSINPKPVVPNQTATICSGTAFSILPVNSPTTTIIPASTTYTWTVVDNVNVTGDAAQTIGVSTIGQTLTNLTNTAQTVVYTVTPTSGTTGNCVGATFTVTVTVNPKAAIANTTATACSGSSFSVTPTNGTDIVPSGTTYAWSSLPVVTGGLTGGATATGQSSISGTLTNPTNTPQTATYTVTPTSGTCVGPTFNVVATINPKPVIVNKTSTICSGDAFSVTPVNGSDIVPASTTYTWTISTNSNITGQSAQSSAQSSIGQTLTNLTNTAQTITYTVTPTSGAAGNCVGSTFTIVVTVNPKTTIANKTATTCSGVAFTVTPTNGTDIVPTGTTYAWSAPVVTGGLTGGASATGQSSITGTLTNPTNTQQTATYTVTPTSGSCVGPTFTVVVTLNPKPVIANKTVTACSAAGFSVIPVNGSDIVPSGTTYTWLTPTVTGLMTGGAGGTAQTSVFGTLTNSTTTTQTATYTVTPTIGSCSGSTFTVIATINPTPTANTITSQVLCNGSTSTAVTFSGTVVGTTYFWTNNNTAIGLAANGSGNISTFTATNSTNAPIVATITVTPIYSNGGQSCSGTPKTFTITVNPTPTVADQTNIAFCKGSSSSIITLSGSLVSGTTYDWTNSNTAIGLASSGTGNIASFVTTNTTNAAISGLITVTPKYTNGGLTCSGTAKTFTISINPIPTVTKPTNQTICVGAGTSTVTFGGSLVTNTVYNWTNNNTAIGLAASGTGDIASFTTTNTTNAPITATITVTPTYTNAGTICSGPSQTFSFTVNPKPAIPDQTVTTCTGSTFSFAPANSGSTIVPSSTTYTWTIFTNNPNLTGQTASASAQSTISQTLTSSLSSNQDIVYEVTPTSGGCVGSKFKLTVSVNNKTIISNIAQTVCTGESFSISPTGAISGTTYTWNSPTVTGGLTGGTSGTTQNAIAGTLSTVSNTTQSATYSVTPVLSVSSACTANPFSVVITVVPKPVIGNQTASICSGNTVAIAPANGGSTIVPSSTLYTWIIKTDNSDITGQSANATPASSFTQTLTGTTNAAKDIVYTVTPQNGNCAGTSFDVTVTVTPKLVVPDQDLNLCSGGTFTVTPANAPPTTLLPDGTTYTWKTNLAGFLNISIFTNIFDYIKTDAADLDDAVSGNPTYTKTKYIGNSIPNIISYVGDAQLNSILGGTAFGQYASTKITGYFKAKETGTYTFTFEGSDAHHFKLGGNIIASQYGFLFTDKDPLGTHTGTVSLTAGQYYPIQLVQFRGNYTNGAIQFYWKRPSQSAWQQDMDELYAEIPSSYTGISGITTQNVAQSSISQTLSNSTNAPITVKYVVTPVSSVTGNCAIAPFLINATVNPTPSVANATASVCSENNYTFVSTNNADILPVGTTYTWTISADNTDLTGQTAASTSQSSFTQTLVNTTNVAKNIEYTVTPTFATCTGTAFKITLTVNPKPIVPNQSATICSGESFTISPTNDPPNTLIPTGTKYTWRNDLRGFLNYAAFPYMFYVSPNDKAGLDGFFTGSPTYAGTRSIDPSGINLLNWNDANQLNNLIGSNLGDFFAYKLTGYFIPSETGTYTFSVEGDDAVDVLINGNAVAAHYGGHGADPIGTHTGTISLTAGQSYAIQVRHQDTWGGEALKMFWKRPSQNAWQQDETELYAALPVSNSSITGMSAQATPQSTISQTLVNTTNVPVTVTYVVKPIGVSTGNCTGGTFNVDVTVNPKPTIANKTATICSGGTIAINPVNATDIVPANTTYTWTISSDNADLTGQTAESTAQSNFSQSLVNTTNAPKTIVYTVTPTSGAAGSCVGATFTVTVTVNPIPVIPNTLTTICSGNAFTVSPSGTSGSTIVPVGTTYTWSVAANSNVTGQTNQLIAQNSISQTLTNLTNGSETVIYTVTPLANGCSGNNFTLSVVVAPKPIIANISAAICSDDVLQVTPTNGSNIVPANTEYTWTILTDNNSITGQAAQNVAQSSISQHLINTTSSVQTITYTVTPNAGSCAGSSFVLSVTVYPIPTIANKVTTVCSDYAFTVTPNSVGDIIPASTKYTWTILNDNNNLTGQSAISVLQNAISQTLHNTTDINQTIVYTVTPSSGAAGSCVGLPFTTTVTVLPTPVIPALTNTICSGGTFTVTPSNAGTTIVPAGTTYTWTIRTNNNNLSGQSAVSSAQNNISQTLVNSTNVNQDIIYEVTPTSGNCVGTPFVLTVTVNPTPVIPNQFATVCSGGIFTVSPQNNGTVIVPAGTTYTWTVIPNANVTGTSDVNTPSNNISQQLINTSSSDQTVVYTVTPTSGNCVGSSFEISVIVHAKIRPLDQMAFVCSGQTFNATAMGSVPVGTLYSWTVPNVTGGLTGGTTGTTQNNITGTLINPTNTVQTATYTVTPILVAPFDLCEVYDFVTVVTIHPKATIANVTAQICSSDSYSFTPQNAGSDIVPLNTNYTWTIQTNNTNIAGQSSQFAPQNSFAQQLTNLTNTDQTIVYLVTPRSGMCAGDNFTVTITVHPKPSIMPQVATICSGTAFVVNPVNTGMNIVPAGTTYTWTILNDNNNIVGQSVVSVSSNSVSQVLTNTTNQSQTITYQVAPTSGAAGGCIGNNFFVHVTVTPKPFVADQQTEICSGGTFSVVPANGNGNIVPGGTLYSWTIFTNNNNITGQANETNEHPVIYQTLVNTSNVDQTIVYEVTPRTGSCTGTTFKVSVIVHPAPTVPNQIITICSENGFTLNPSSITGAVVPTNSTYTWTIVTDNNLLTGQQAQNIGQAVISQTLTNTVNTQQTIVYSVAPLSGVAGGCAGSPFTLTVYVDPKPTITNQTAELCSGSSFVASPLNGNGNIVPAGTTYTYTIETNNNLITGQSAQSNAQNNISQALVNTTNIDQVIVYRVTPTAGNCMGNTFLLTVTVHPKPTIPAAVQTICSGSSFLITPVNSGSTIIPANTTYTWTVANNVSITGKSNQVVPQNNISQTLTSSSFVPQDIVYTVTPISGAAGSCVGGTFTVTITVNPIPNVNGVNNQVICNGSTTTGITFTGNVVGTVYNWSNTNTAIGLGASGVGNIASFVTTNTTNATISGTITATPIYTNAGLGCTGTPTSFSIAVNPIPTVNAVANQTICVGGSTTLVTPTGNVAGTVYNWTSSNTAIGLAANGTGNIPSFVTTNTGNTPISSTITITPTYTNGSVSCSGAPITFTITVNPIPNVNGVNNQVICNGSTTTGITFTGNVVGTVYNWSNTNTAIGLGASGVGNIASFVTTNTTNATISGTITATPIYTNAGLGCTGTPTSFSIAVNPIPTVNAVANQTICVGGSTTLVTPTGNVAGTVYNWTSSNTAIGLAANGTGNIPSFVTTNTGNTPISSTITITPTYTNGSVSCSGAPITFTITVNPIPTVNGVNSQVICNGSTTTGVTFTGNVAGTVYNWSNTNTAIGLGASGIGNIASFVTTNTTNATISGTITATPVYTNAGLGCTGAPTSFSIAVNPIPTVNVVSNQELCTGSPTAAVIFTGFVPNTNYNWTNSNTTIGLGASGVGNIPSFTTINTGTLPQVATITITPKYSNLGLTCTGSSKQFTYTVNAVPSVANITETICSETRFTTIPVDGGVNANIVPPNTKYTWTVAANSNVSGQQNQVVPQASISQVLTNLTNVVQTVVYTVTPISGTNGACFGNTFTITVTVNPKVTIPNQVVSICSEGSFSLTPATFTGVTIIPVGSTFSWPMPTLSGTITGAATGANQNFVFGTLTNPTNTEQTAVYTITPLSGNCTGNVFTISVEVKPKPHLSSATTAPTICTNSLFNYAAQSTVTNTSFSWTRSAIIGIQNPANSSNGNVIKEILINTTNAPIVVPYTFTLTARGCVVNETITVTILPTVQAQFASNNSAINCAPFVYNTYSTPSDFASVRWYYTDNNNVIIGNVAGYNSSFTFVQPGSYKVAMIAYHANGCPDTLQKPVTVTTSALVNFSPIDSIYCGPSKSVTFTNNTTYAGQGAVTYKWLIDGVVVSTNATNYTHNFTTLPSQIGVKKFVVTLEATTAVSGCVSILSKNIYILPTPKSIFTTTPTSGCIPLTITFANTSLYADTYKWYVNDSLFSTSQLPSALVLSKPNQAYKFKLVASANSGCASDSSEQIVNTLPNPTVNFAINNLLPICKFASVDINNTSYFGTAGNVTGLSYNWLINGVLQTSTIANPSFVLSNNSNILDTAYAIKLILSTAAGCKDSLQKTVVIKPAPKPIFSIVGGNVFCSQKNLTLDLQNTSVGKGSLIYNWSIRNVATSSTFAKLSTINAAQPQIILPDNFAAVDSVYEIKLTVTTTDGCSSDSSISIRIHPRPQSTIVLNNIASCGPTIITATGSNSTIIKTSNWTISSSNLSAPIPVSTITANTAQFSFSENLTGQSIQYRIRVIDTTLFGCSDTSITQFILYPKPAAKFTYSRIDSCATWTFTVKNNSVVGDNDAPSTGNYLWTITKRGAMQPISAASLFGIVSGINPSFTFTNTGSADSIYDVQLRVTNKYGCLDSVTQSFTVHAKPKAKILAGITTADAPFNIARQNNLLAVDYPTINGSYTWRVLHPVSRAILATTNDFYINPYTLINSDDSVIVQLVVNSLFNCAADTTSILFKTLPSIVADFTRSDSVDCAGNTAFVFTDISISKSAAIVDRYWDFGDGVTANGAQVSHTYKLPGIYWVSLYVKDANGIVSKKAYKRVVVIGPAIVDFVATNACEGATTFFLNNSQLGYGSKAFTKIFWDFGDGNSSTIENPSHIYKAAGVYNVTLTLRGDSSCLLSSKTKTITIYGKPAADFNFSDNCINLPIQFNNKTVPSKGESNYAVIGWEFGDGTFSTLTDPQHTYNVAGTYTVRLIVSSNICSQSRDTITKQIKVTIPRASMVYPLVKATRNRALTLVAQPGGISYVWSPSIGLLGPNQQSPTAKYTLLDPNKINYTITIKDSSGCVIKDAQEVWVFDKSDVFVPTAFSPNADGANDVLLPFYINIAKLNYFRIYDRWGKLVFETNDLKKSWDGLVNGKQAPLETYAWTVACVDADGKLLLRKGMVTMIRD